MDLDISVIQPVFLIPQGKRFRGQLDMSLVVYDNGARMPGQAKLRFGPVNRDYFKKG